MPFMKTAFKAIAVIFCVLIAWLLLWPTPVEPVAWEAPAAPPLEGAYGPNNILSKVTRIEIESGYGPEDVAVDAMGFIYGGTQQGKILKFHPETHKAEEFADTGGRPLGLHFNAGGDLIVADAFKGLLRIAPQGKLEVLSTEAGGVPFLFTDDLDIAADGTIYFSDASYKYDQHHYKLDAIEHQPNGRLLAYYPETRQTEILLDKLHFANGVAVSPDQQFVLVNETWEYRVTRYWIAGERKGQSEVFLENLPGFPDGISCNGVDTFWVALASPRNPLLDNLSGKPFLRKVISRLPEFMQPKAIPFAFVLGADVNGRITHNLQEPSGKPFHMITSVQQHGDTLWLGSLEEPALAFLPVPEPNL